ncbi:MAG: DsbA family protein [Propionibacteriaceae bacterium]|jgi:protein-disulfide isomerase|nr:DsbA family protein [Propionibacteriaceae bacterium]
MANRSQAARSRRAELEAQRLAQAKKQRQLRIFGAAGGLLVIAVVVALTIWGVNGSKTGGSDIPPSATADKNAISLTPNVSSSAPTLDIFSDFQCPGCKSYHDALGDVIDDYIEAGTVNIIIHQMTFLDRLNTDGNPNSSTRSAVGAACADFAGKYLAYYDAVYDNQPSDEGPGYSDSLLRDTIPAGIGISGDDLTAFQTCYDTRATGQFVQDTDDEGSRGMAQAGSQTTPVYALNGENITTELGSASSPASKLKELLDNAI